MKDPARPPRLEPSDKISTLGHFLPKADDQPADFVPAWLAKHTYRVEHNPNCPSPYLVRLIAKNKARIVGDKTDACGYGKTLQQAAENARKTQGE